MKTDTENITPEIMNIADACRKAIVSCCRDHANGSFNKSKSELMKHALERYRLCLEIMKLEKEL